MNTRLSFAIALAVALFVSAIATVYVQHYRRMQFVELRVLERERDAMQVEWGQLKLEQSTWATHERIERLALKKLDLHMPPAAEVVLVSPGEQQREGPKRSEFSGPAPVGEGAAAGHHRWAVVARGGSATHRQGLLEGPG
jgi:cell division protein FtsL